MTSLSYAVLAAVAVLATPYALSWWLAKRMQGRSAPASAAGPGRRLYYFFSAHCGMCRTVTPAVDRLAAEHPNVIKVDVGKEPEKARAFGVAATPTLMLVENGRIARVIVGRTSRDRLLRLLSA